VVRARSLRAAIRAPTKIVRQMPRRISPPTIRGELNIPLIDYHPCVSCGLLPHGGWILFPPRERGAGGGDVSRTFLSRPQITLCESDRSLRRDYWLSLAHETRTHQRRSRPRRQARLFERRGPLAPIRNGLAVTAFKAAAGARANGLAATIEAIGGEGVTSANGIAGALNARSIATPRGGMWTGRRVLNLMARLA
jgi:hypothetical protein